MWNYAIAAAVGVGFFAHTCIGHVCTLINSEPLNDYAEIDKAIEAVKEFTTVQNKVLTERDTILSTLNRYASIPGSLSQPKGKISQPQEKSVTKELSDKLERNLLSYPIFNEKKRHDLRYIWWIHNELEMHHEKTKVIAEQYFEILDAAFPFRVECAGPHFT